MTESYVIGIDLGGTEIKAGLVDRDLKISGQAKCPTDASRGPDAVVGNMVALVQRLEEVAEQSHQSAALPETVGAPVSSGQSSGDGSGRVAGLGVGTPGPLSPSRGVVYRSVNLPGWHDLPLRDIIAERTNLPVAIDNDANLAAYGEYRANPDVSNLVLLTLGTGVGAGTILNGSILHGHHDNASEWGHMIIRPGGRPCKCGQQGCLEMYASAHNVAVQITEQIKSGAGSSLAGIVESGGSIDASHVASAAREGDALAMKYWDEACHALAVACVNIQHAVNPKRILLGGGMSQAGEFLLGPVRRHYGSMRWKLHNDDPEIALATLGSDAGIIGAAALALDNCNSDRQ